MKKIIRWSVIIYALYCIGIAFYLFVLAHSSIPSAWKGTSADPATFLTPRELLLSEHYSQLKNFLYFISLPYEWIVYLIILFKGISKKMELWATRATRWWIVQAAVYVFWLSLIVSVATLPLDFIGYRISRAYGISTQPFLNWLRDETTDFLVNTVLLIFIIIVLYWLIRRFEKRWWLYAWIVSIPFTIFLMFIQPVVIDPLYNSFYPLKDKVLEEKILAMAQRAHIPADHVFEVNMSEKTNALNAYVTGIGSHARIVLWDTTLKRLKEQEVLFIMAHEMGHYVMKHVYWGVAGYIVLILFGLFVTNRLMRWSIGKWRGHFQIKSIGELASLPLLLLTISLLQFAASPFVNAVSRYEEHAADKYAIELTQNTDAGISTFQKLAQAGLSEVYPPALVKWFRYTHPTIFERILFLRSVKSKDDK
ncbi:M48 family metallopeptidase [Anoxybacteroides tepidamans]|uniref:M48 family metallopeptidase n=1 Tax=Anoxybacteroides tepidamans TaxID=265948 RepID=UPI0004849005|nr:M48 family metallopeptidase [Anoxybacillus tepidamans]